MKVNSCTLAVAAAIVSGGAAAQTTPELVVAGFTQAAKSNPALAARVTAIKRNVAVVLVPGILGSRLVSPTQGNIWGVGKPEVSKLLLPANLVDEGAASDVQATLLDSYYGDQYGEAFKAIKAAASQVGAKAIACGFDWRRDLRVGAADVERCIQRELGPEKHTLIFVSHSMGGIVTSVWNTLHEQKKYSGNHLVGGIAILGSPLQGSCEILRMVNEGYKQPEQNTLPENRFQYEWQKVDTFLTGAANNLTGLLTDGIRSAVLTWPGAFELTPKLARTDAERSCVILRASANEGDPNLVSYYDGRFWTSPVGTEVLKGAKPPAHFESVLAKARDFRNTFTFSQPQAPTYAYFSIYWHTPENAMLRPGGGLDIGKAWEMVKGDGRVPSPAGGARPNADWLSDYKVVYSVHGGIPKDAVFQDHFLKDRLKTLVPALVAYRLMTEVGATDEGLTAYAEAGGIAPGVSSFQGAIDAPAATPTEPRSPLGVELAKAANAFNDRLCAKTRSRCADSIATAKDLLKGVTDAGAVFGPLEANETLPAVQRAQARAQIGLASARQGNMSIAGASLGRASSDLGALTSNRPMTDRGRTELGNLSLIVDRNLATALRETGQCSAAKAILVGLQSATPRFRGDLKMKCFDRDTGLFQALEDY